LKGTLLIQNGKVIAAGTSVNTKKHNYSQFRRKSIYPSFIDMYTSFGMDKPKKTEGSRQSQSTQKTRSYWNEHIRSKTISTTINPKLKNTESGIW
jgi:dihydroorotase-like cyclic amidohydrolase